jgi:hypothetical protein
MATIPRAYATNMSSIKALELTCEADEANLSAKIISLQLGTDDGTKVTAGTYDDSASGINFGHLAFEEYKTAVDEQSLKAIHQSKGDSFIKNGEAYIQDKVVKVLLFREKP